MVAQKLGISILRYLYWQHSKGTFSKYLWHCWEYNLVLNLIMITTDVRYCNHNNHISVIWVHFEKLVDEIAARTHWSGTAPLPLPLLCHPPFLQVNGTAAQQHFIILFSVTMATITGVTKSMITAIMTIITLVTITRSASPGWGWTTSSSLSSPAWPSTSARTSPILPS